MQAGVGGDIKLKIKITNVEEIKYRPVQWEYMALTILKEDDIAERLNFYGKCGWECFHIDVTPYGSTAFLKKINYIAMEAERLEWVAKTTGGKMSEILKSESFNNNKH